MGLWSVLSIAVIVLIPPLKTQQGCPEKPRALAAMRDCSRPLLVFAPGAEDGRFKAQLSALTGAAGKMAERQMLLVPMLADGRGYQTLKRMPAAALPEEEQAKLRKQFGVGPGEFRVVLVGKDGGEKFTSGEPVAAEALFGTVDAMPMRREEVRRGR